jgi:hypothetical protein
MDCDKLKFKTYRDAQEYISNWDSEIGGKKPSRIYHCSKCNMFHMTKKRVRTLWGFNGNRSKTKANIPIDPPKSKESNSNLNIKTNLIDGTYE